MEKKPLTVQIARWSAIHPWRAISIWIVLVLTAVLVGGWMGTDEDTTDGAIGEFARAQQLIDSGDFPEQPLVEQILITARSGALDTEAATSAATDAAARFSALSGVSSVEGPLPSQDGTSLLLSVSMAGDPDTADTRVEPLLELTEDLQDAYPNLRIEEAGMASISYEVNEAVADDFTQAELFSIPVTLVILIVTFGALIAAGVPVLLALSAVAAAIGMSSIASHLVPANSYVNSVILLIGMAVGVDYSLFYLRREREERARGVSSLDAVEIAAATSGRAVVVSALAVIVSMGGMFLANDSIFSSFAIGSILVVAVSMLGSLTVLPAVLAKLGRWVDRPRIPLVWRLAPSGRTDGTSRVWSVILTPALRHPAITLIVAAGALIGLSVPTLDMNLRLVGLADLPRDIAVMTTYDRLTAAYPSTGSTHVVVVRADAEYLNEVNSALDTLNDQLSTNNLFAHDQEPTRTTSPDNTVTTVEIGLAADASDVDSAERSLALLRGTLLPQDLDSIDSIEYAVSGDTASTVDYTNHVKEKLPLVIGFVLLLTFLVIMWTFRSVVIAGSAILLNLLSAGAAYGLLVIVFQHTWAEDLLGFESNGTVVAWLPLFLFVVLFGLSMDYHVFVVSRIKEAYRSGMSNREAVASGITRSAGVVTSAAIVMVGVFSIFGTLSFMEMKQLGIGLAVAILVDATIIRAVVLPSLMTLLGDANWWTPRFLRRPEPPQSSPVVPTGSGAGRRDLTPVA